MSVRKSKYPNRFENEEEDSSLSDSYEMIHVDTLDDENLEQLDLPKSQNSPELSDDVTIHYMCRVCTSKDTHLSSIYDVTENSLKICDMLSTLIPQVLIRSSDLLPKFICSSCLEKLFISYEFQEMYITSDAYLRNILESKLVSSSPERTESRIEHESVYIEEVPNETEEIVNMNEIVKKEINDDSITPAACESTILNRRSKQYQDQRQKKKSLNEEECAATSSFDNKSSGKIKSSMPEKINAMVEDSENNIKTQCPHCDKLFDCPETLKRHLQVFKCDLCGKEFPKTRLLALHLLTHPENQKYKCALCEKTFPYQTRLDEHMNKHNGIKPFECGTCEKSFYRRKALSTHMRTHKGKRDFDCHICGNAFKSSGNLSQHMMVHAKEKPYLCDMCGASFARVEALKLHKKTHYDERPYNCDECDKSFKLLSQIKRHMKIHAGDKPHKCELCERAFTESNDLKKHLRRHIGENIYKCKKCSEAFVYKKNLIKHEQDHFNEEQQQQNSQITELNINII